MACIVYCALCGMHVEDGRHQITRVAFLLLPAILANEEGSPAMHQSMGHPTAEAAPSGRRLFVQPLDKFDQCMRRQA